MNFDCQADVFQLLRHRQYLFVTGTTQNVISVLNTSKYIKAYKN